MHQANEHGAFIVCDEATVCLRGSTTEHLTLRVAEHPDHRWSWSIGARIGAAGHGGLPSLRHAITPDKATAVLEALECMREYVERIAKYDFGGGSRTPQARAAFTALYHLVTMGPLFEDGDGFKEVDHRQHGEMYHWVANIDMDRRLTPKKG